MVLTINSGDHCDFQSRQTINMQKRVWSFHSKHVKIKGNALFYSTMHCVHQSLCLLDMTMSIMLYKYFTF